MQRFNTSPFRIRFGNGPSGLCAGILTIVAAAQLLVFMSTYNILSLILFLLIYAYVSYQTTHLCTRLAIPIFSTYFLTRSNILAHNFKGLGAFGNIEGLRNSRSKIEGFQSRSDDTDEDDNENDNDTDDDDDDDDDDDATDDANQPSPADLEPLMNIQSNEINSSIDTLENAVDRLEGSFKKIMHIGSTLGIDKQLSDLGSSLDITSVLNQKQDLTRKRK